MVFLPSLCSYLQAQFTWAFWGQRGTMTQHQHTYSTAYKKALSLCPLDSRIPCLSLLQELEQTGSPFVLPAVWPKAFPTPIAFLHKKNTHRSKLWLEKFTAGWGKSHCSCSCWADIQPVFHSSALSFEEYLRTGHVQAYKGFFFSELKGRYEYEGGMGPKDIRRQHHTPT